MSHKSIFPILDRPTIIDRGNDDTYTKREVKDKLTELKMKASDIGRALRTEYPDSSLHRESTIGTADWEKAKNLLYDIEEGIQTLYESDYIPGYKAKDFRKLIKRVDISIKNRDKQSATDDAERLETMIHSHKQIGLSFSRM